MPLNSYATLGRSGLRVSPFCLGTMTFGEDWGWGVSPEDSSKIIRTFLERGGNFVDTSDARTDIAAIPLSREGTWLDGVTKIKGTEC
jgi:predicted aldo/keto reductase-like oxidoreductase